MQSREKLRYLAPAVELFSPKPYRLLDKFSVNAGFEDIDFYEPAFEDIDFDSAS